MGREIKNVRKLNEDKLLKLKNVVGVGTGKKIVDGKETDRECIRIYVAKKEPIMRLRSKDVAPQSVDHVETDIIEIGEIVAFGNTEYMRPAKGGISIGHKDITAGTFGCVCRDKKTKELLILSNNHVLANSNKAKIGDDIYQPGRVDGGTQANLIAALLRFIPIGSRNPWWAFWKKEPKNLVDCAVAMPLDEDDLLPEIIEIGEPRGTASVKVGDEVQKSGRTTGWTTGKVIDDDVTVTVNYGKFVAKFTNQIMFSAMSAGGDSGSVILNKDKKIVSLLYAGSPKVTMGNPIDKVMELLNVKI